MAINNEYFIKYHKAEMKIVVLESEIIRLKEEVNYWCDPETPNVIYDLEKG